MSGLRRYLRRHTVWVWALAVLLPLAVLLGFQYVWLARLKRTTTIAHRATLSNYLEAAASQIEFFYRSNAERALIMPSQIYTQKVPHKAAFYFKRREILGARHVFVANFVDADFALVLFYNPETQEMEDYSHAEAAQAVFLACAPYRVQSDENVTLTSAGLVVDERDLQNRIILNPITDESSRIVGVAGMVVDEGFFRDELLPKMVEKSLPRFFSPTDAADMVVTVRDADGRQLFPLERAPRGGAEVTRAIPFLFTDYRLGLRSLGMSPERWAQSNFAVNLTLSALLALVLLGGIVLALRAAAREIRLSRMKSDFVSNVSHELRTPLASIRVFGEFLRLGRVNDVQKIREYGEVIETESRRLTQLINNILDFSKIESGVKTYSLEPADLGEVVHRVLKTFRVRLEHSGFQVHLEEPEEPLPAVPMDVTAVRQGINNLLDNAVKYSGDAREITVVLGRTDGYVTVGVQDGGIGISREDQRKIFERFHRVGSSLVHDVKGAGLGLAIVSHIVQAHHGKVTVRSDPGKGSTFTLHLPVERPPEPAEGLGDVEPPTAAGPER